MRQGTTYVVDIDRTAASAPRGQFLSRHTNIFFLFLLIIGALSDTNFFHLLFSLVVGALSNTNTENRR